MLVDTGLISFLLTCAGRPKEPSRQVPHSSLERFGCTREVRCLCGIGWELKMNWTALVCTPQAVAKLRVCSTPAVVLKAMLAAVCKVAISLPDAALYLTMYVLYIWTFVCNWCLLFLYPSQWLWLWLTKVTTCSSNVSGLTLKALVVWFFLLQFLNPLLMCIQNQFEKG